MPGVAFAKSLTGRGSPRGGSGASCLPRAALTGRRLADGRVGSAAGGRASYLGQQPHAPPAAAWPAAPAAAGAPRGGAAGAFLLSRRRRRRRRRLPGRAQNIHGLCPGSRPPRPGCSPRRMPGTSAKFFVPLTCSLASARPPQDPASAVPSQPSGYSLASAGRSVPGCLCRPRGGRVSPARARKSVPCARGLSSRAPSVPAAAAPPAPRAPSLALSLAQLVTFHQLSNPAPEPRPMADTSPGRRPSALCCRLSTSTPSDVPESCRSRASHTPASPPPPRLKPEAGPEPWEPSRPFDGRGKRGSGTHCS